MENKKSSGILYFILILIILGLAGYIVIDKNFLSKEPTESAEKTVIDDVELNLNVLFQIGDTLSRFDSAFNTNDSSYFGYIYNLNPGKKLLAEKMDKAAATYAAMHKDLVPTNTLQNIIGGKVKYNYEKMFGKYSEYEPTQVNAGSFYNIVYNINTNNYDYIVTTQYDNYQPQYFATDFSTSLDKEDLVVTRKIYYVEYSQDKTKALIYKNADKKDYVGEIELRNGILNTKETLDKFGSRLGMYRYRFKYKNENEFNFYSIERIK